MTLSASNPNYEMDLRSALGASAVFAFLGIEITAVEPGSVELTLHSRPELCQAKGIIQAGITGALADFAGGSAAATMLPPGWTVLTTDYTIKLLTPASGARLVARARVLAPGRTLLVAQTDVVSVNAEGRERLCATALVSLMAMELSGRARERS